MAMNNKSPFAGVPFTPRAFRSGSPLAATERNFRPRVQLSALRNKHEPPFRPRRQFPVTRRHSRRRQRRRRSRRRLRFRLRRRRKLRTASEQTQRSADSYADRLGGCPARVLRAGVNPSALLFCAPGDTGGARNGRCARSLRAWRPSRLRPLIRASSPPRLAG